MNVGNRAAIWHPFTQHALEGDMRAIEAANEDHF